jgi:hypothetical protein
MISAVSNALLGYFLPVGWKVRLIRCRVFWGRLSVIQPSTQAGFLAPDTRDKKSSRWPVAPTIAAQNPLSAFRRRSIHVCRHPGTILTRPYKGQQLHVQVLTDGFAYAGHVYPSLSAVAKVITGTHTNGFLFFRNTLNHHKETA